MKLHSIHLQNYRGIVDSRVEFADGVTVVEGPNEIGKSSIHEAITQLREDKASSRKGSVKETQPVGADVGPEVEVHLTTGDYELKYRKRWLKQPFTELNVLRPRPEQLSSDDAHERFLAILDETVDVDLLHALDVAQGSSLAQAPLAQIKALHSALNESGVELADHDAFLDRVEAEYAKYYTAKGRETGEYKDINARVPEAEAAYEELLERSRDMDELVDRHARATSRLESVAEALAKALGDRSDAEESARAVAELRASLDQVVDRAKSLERDEQIAREAVLRRTTLIEDVSAAEASVTSATRVVSELETSQSEKDSEFDAAQTALTAKQDELEQARARAKQKAKVLARTRARTEMVDLRRRLSDIRELEEKRAQAQATIGSIAVGAKDVELLSSLETEVRIAENAKTSAAAQVIAKRLGEQEVLVDDGALTEAVAGEFAVVRDLQISIAGIVEITVRPGASPAELDKAITASMQALESELAGLEVETVAQARERAEVRAAAESGAAEAASTLKVLLGKDKREDLEAALARAEHLVGEDDSDRGDRSEEVSLEELESGLAEAETAVEAAQLEVDSARAALERTRATRDDARVETVRAQTSLEEATSGLERVRAALERARATASDEDLQEAAATAAAAAETIGAKVAEARAKYEAADPETLEMKLENARQLVGSKEAQRETDRQEVDRLSALIDDRAGEGIYEKLAAAEESMETARAKQARLTRQAEAIDLLRSTVLARKEEAQRKYVAPFKDQIERLGRLIFGPGLAVDVSEDLEIVSRTLDGRTVAFESLSGGTREQLALIGRLAVATLVDEGSGAPVVLDDAFGFADAERLGALNVILGNVGRSAQVILLTCQPDRFAGIGGATTVSLD